MPAIATKRCKGIRTSRRQSGKEGDNCYKGRQSDINEAKMRLQKGTEFVFPGTETPNMTEFVFTISPRSFSPKFARIEDVCNKLRRSDINKAKRQS